MVMFYWKKSSDLVLLSCWWHYRSVHTNVQYILHRCSHHCFSSIRTLISILHIWEILTAWISLTCFYFIFKAALLLDWSTHVLLRIKNLTMIWIWKREEDLFTYQLESPVSRMIAFMHYLMSPFSSIIIPVYYMAF